APDGTVKVSVSLVTAKKLLTAAPFRVTPVAVAKLVPATVTTVPTGPLAGVKLAMVGAGATGAKTT
nr:hypothetical protein [Tanacetum cinerariifolium]